MVGLLRYRRPARRLSGKTGLSDKLAKRAQPEILAGTPCDASYRKPEYPIAGTSENLSQERFFHACRKRRRNGGFVIQELRHHAFRKHGDARRTNRKQRQYRNTDPDSGAWENGVKKAGRQAVQTERHGAREGTRTPTPQWRQDLNLVRLPISPPSHLHRARNFTAFCPVWDGLPHRAESVHLFIHPFTGTSRGVPENRHVAKKSTIRHRSGSEVNERHKKSDGTHEAGYNGGIDAGVAQW